ncbi:MAG: hypothetical protein ACRBG0_01415 [Lewinella sp.]|uniref:hypothetical protein n=1 Tax=Lewinella sp. TaxID=2004506 RepID=UPI003D6A8FB5
MEEDKSYLSALQTFVNVLEEETRQVVYVIRDAPASELRKAGSRSKRFTFFCVNCSKLTTKRSRARYCCARCRKQAERKREAAISFLDAFKEDLGLPLRRIATKVLLRRDKKPGKPLRKEPNSCDTSVHNC